MLRILHTADWHIGQLFYEYDRTYEHRQFLNWLIKTLSQEQIDVLLISGDVFDLSNPSAASIRIFYSFLSKAATLNPDLQIIVTAGNHDSASRLEAPKPFLESSNIHIIGLVERDENGAIDYKKILIPLKDKKGTVQAWCIAAPFLRMGDYPVIPDADNPYAAGVTAFYEGAYRQVSAQKQAGQAIIAMGHLHTRQAEVGDIDKMERLIMGGAECISASAFDDAIAYVALGHIHKAQRIGGKEHIRYCGSPLPMSFSEVHYKHQVIVFDLKSEGIEHLKTIEIPVSVPLQHIPAVHSSLAAVLDALAQLPMAEADATTAPYLEVRVLLNGPEPGLRHKIETAITGKHVRLAKIDVRYKTASPESGAPAIVNAAPLSDLKPLDVFSRVYLTKYNNPVPEALLQLFQQAIREVNESEAAP
ncbi:exonuclease sbcCD subunit D [Niabella ginsenosidivorans]|uniref:Nuclease SbcCD subunit D n=1 Tax=Niabella ginsenosidivorans TaxID=1176587 RepID=A0A1A9I1Q6_9BACT|nr:exonuclease SbcCD subunit D C-terminal domain-containing protein [Niabella ginsenosidivorans]ANH81597.1 exonuclease sbcCD subunit D [Niabella ginsenosidivorans]